VKTGLPSVHLNSFTRSERAIDKSRLVSTSASVYFLFYQSSGVWHNPNHGKTYARCKHVLETSIFFFFSKRVPTVSQLRSFFDERKNKKAFNSNSNQRKTNEAKSDFTSVLAMLIYFPRPSKDRTDESTRDLHKRAAVPLFENFGR